MSQAFSTCRAQLLQHAATQQNTARLSQSDRRLQVLIIAPGCRSTVQRQERTCSAPVAQPCQRCHAECIQGHRTVTIQLDWSARSVHQTLADYLRNGFVE